VNWRILSVIGLVIFILGNLLTLASESVSMLIGVRLIAGLGGGFALSVAFAQYGSNRSPDSAFGIFLVVGMLFSAVGLYSLPAISGLGGIEAVIGLLVLLAVIAMVAIRWLPADRHEARGMTTSATPRHSGAPYLIVGIGLLAVSCFMLAEGAVWTYLDRIGGSKGFSATDVANSLAVSSLAGIGGGLLAIVVRDRFGRSVPLVLSAVASIASLWMFTGGSAFSVFVTAACIFNFCWNFTQALMSGVMSELDPKGRAVVLMGGAQTAAFGIGPGLIALVLTGNNYAVISYFGGILIFASLVIILIVIAWQYREKAIPDTSAIDSIQDKFTRA
jgi:predicted MFS family arabinose efflux permease